MAWTIHRWSAESGTGEIKSPHFGPTPFEASANVDRVSDFREGEAVMVELDGAAPEFRVRLIRPMRQRQPLDTHWPPFDAINGFGDANVEEQTPTVLQLWIGDCCAHCTPSPRRVRFEGITQLTAVDEEIGISNPLFRLASAAEARDQGLVVPEDATAFCIVTDHGNGRDGPLVFVVAQAAHVL